MKIQVGLWILVVCLFLSCQPNYLRAKKTKFLRDPDSLRQAALCTYTGRFTKEERRGFFPFSKARKIEIITYENPSFYAPTFVDEYYAKARFPKRHEQKQATNRKSSNQETVTATIIDTTALTDAQIDKLTDVLFNYDYSDNSVHFVEVGASCYQPRHSFIFYNRNNRAFAKTDICFSCQRIEWSNKKIKSLPFCNGKWDLLRSFFRECGVTQYLDR
jgi:hypothetical protein